MRLAQCLHVEDAQFLKPGVIAGIAALVMGWTS